MRHFLNKYGIAILITAFILVIVPLASTHAQALNLFGFKSIGEYIEMFFAYLINILISIMSIIVAIAGYLLNFSINLTLNIKSFVDSTPAIFTTWRTIRDISGLFMIFFLLYASFQLITGLKRPNFGELIKNIVVAGILINFSFFVAGLGIDASNIISVQIYNAIAPANNLNPNAATTSIIGGTWKSSFDGGLSDIFMNHLHVQSLYTPKLADMASAGSASGAAATAAGNAVSSVVLAPVKIIIMGAIALIIELAAAMSFGAAAIAFIFRFVVLILLLAFSPIWMLGFLPEVGAYSKKWSSHYWNMLIFMPIYLLLMYVALSVLTTSPIFNDGTGSLLSGATNVGNNSWYSSFLVLGVNAVIVIVLLNLPLAAAASVAGGTIGFLKKAADKVGYDKWFGMASGYVGSKTVGRAAATLDESIGKTRLGNTLLARDIRAATTQSVAKTKFGGDRSYEDYKKEDKETKKRYSEINRRNAYEGALARVTSDGATAEDHAELKKRVGEMNAKGRTGALQALMKDETKAKQLIRFMKGSDFEDIKKSDEWTDDDKDKVTTWRKEALQTAIIEGDTEGTKSLVSNMDGKDLMGIKNGHDDNLIILEDEVLEHVKPSQLKTMSEEGLDQNIKDEIGKRIMEWKDKKGKPHKSRGHINSNKEDWGVESSDKKSS